MTATIINMDLVWADKLTPGSLMIDDLIKVDDELIEVRNIDSDATGDNYFIEYTDVYGESDTVTISHDAYVDLYVYIETEEQGPGAPNVRFALIKIDLYFSHFSDKINI